MRHFSIILCAVILTAISSCKKDNVAPPPGTKYIAPQVWTTEPTSIGDTYVICGGIIDSQGSSPIIARGVCWAEYGDLPSVNGPKTIDGAGMGTFTSHITGLTPGMKYMFFAYATNSEGTAYGIANYYNYTPDENPFHPTFTTLLSTTVPAVITSNTNWTDINFSVYVGGEVLQEGGATVTSRGVCWDTVPNLSLANHVLVIGNGTGTFTSTLNNLVQGRTYYVRAYATNSFGTAYGDEIHGTYYRTYLPPNVNSVSVSSITRSSAVVQGTASSYPPVFEYGVCWATHYAPSAGENHVSGSGSPSNFTGSITGLSPNTTYHARAYATNGYGYGYGEDIEFTTLP